MICHKLVTFMPHFSGFKQWLKAACHNPNISMLPNKIIKTIYNLLRHTATIHLTHITGISSISESIQRTPHWSASIYCTMPSETSVVVSPFILQTGYRPSVDNSVCSLFSPLAANFDLACLVVLSGNVWCRCLIFLVVFLLVVHFRRASSLICVLSWYSLISWCRIFSLSYSFSFRFSAFRKWMKQKNFFSTKSFLSYCSNIKLKKIIKLEFLITFPLVEVFLNKNQYQLLSNSHLLKSQKTETHNHSVESFLQTNNKTLIYDW